MRIPRWYCRDVHCTFSLLPDCLAAHLPGSLAECEAVVAELEDTPSLELGADRLRPDVELPGAMRWARHREQRVHAALVVARGLLPEFFAECPPTVSAFRARLGVEPVLPALREHLASHLAQIPSPLGFHPRRLAGGAPSRRRQHRPGPDPPPPTR